jgi:hypothetical protein
VERSEPSGRLGSTMQEIYEDSRVQHDRRH